MKSSSGLFNDSLLENIIRNVQTHLGFTKEHYVGKYVSRNHISGNLVFPMTNTQLKLEDSAKDNLSLNFVDDIQINSNLNVYQIYLNQNGVFRTCLQTVLDCKNSYGVSPSSGSVFKSIDPQRRFHESEQLCSYRLHLCSLVLERFLRFLDSRRSSNLEGNPPSASCGAKNISVCDHKMKQRSSHTTYIVCRTEIKELNGGKNISMSYGDYRILREKDVTRDDEFKNDECQKVSSIVDACITLDLLANKLSMPVYLNLTQDRTMSRNSSSKGAVFVLYTYARLAAIINKFEDFVLANSIQIPFVEEIDFSVLSSSEEKIMVYNYILMFPVLVKEIETELLNKGEFVINKLCLFLAQFSSTISRYYRSTRVLMTQTPNLFPLMFARIYLLRASLQVLHNGFYCLNIEPLSDM